MKKTTEDFIRESIAIHGEKYDYSKSIYISAHTKLLITCPAHGDFWQEPNLHLRRNGCPECAGHKKLTNEEFIERARKIHGERYDYSEVVYHGVNTEVTIICPEHGPFKQRPYLHLRGAGCRACVGLRPHTNESFIASAKQIHGNTYDYSLVNYKNNSTKVRIICPKHGEFLQTPHTHLRGVGCSLCNGTPKKTKEEFILQARTVHGYKYDYTKVNYVNTHSKVCIICPKHGEFYQEAKSHVLGAGCPVCKESTMEKQVREYLKSQKMIFEEQKGFPWLRWKLPMRLDFYLPHYSIAIECQGHQHFQPIQFFGGEKSFKRTQLRDVRKKEQCIKHGIEILYYSNLDVPAVGTNHIFSDIANLVKFIKNIEVKV